MKIILYSASVVKNVHSCLCHVSVGVMDEWTIKTPNPICRLFFKIYLLSDIAALCFTDFIDWRYIHSLVGIFDPTCELLPPWTKELYLCTVAPLSSLWSPPPSQTRCTVFTDIVCLRVGGWIVLLEFYTLFLTRFENDIKGTRFLTSGFFHKSVSPKPLSMPLGSFWIFSKIRGDFRSSRFATGCQRHRLQMQKIFNHKSFNYFVRTPLGSIVNL